MGYYMTVYAVPESVVQRLRDSPQRAYDTLDEAIGWDPDGAADPNPLLSVYLDKAWHAIDWLQHSLHHRAPLMRGGELLGDTESQMRVQDPESVRLWHEELSLTPDAKFRRAYKPELMAKARIYPSVIWLREGEDNIGYVLAYLAGLRRVVATAADLGLAVVCVGGFERAPSTARLMTRILGTMPSASERGS